jgi:CBS-domain-containing membrane protein
MSPCIALQRLRLSSAGDQEHLAVTGEGAAGARQLMAQHQLDRLLVVEAGDRLVGIISEADLRADEGPLA